MRCGAEQYGSDLHGVDQPNNGTKLSHLFTFSSVLNLPSEERLWILSPILFFPERYFFFLYFRIL